MLCISWPGVSLTEDDREGGGPEAARAPRTLAQPTSPGISQFKHSNSYVSAAAAAKLLHSCPTLCDPIDGSPPGSPVPGILQATAVGCHCLLQCRKVKSESEFAQSCETLSDPMDCSPPGSSVHGIFQARVLEWGAIAFSENVYS